MKKVLFTIEGGLGKHIIATALMKELKERYSEVNVVSPYPDIMQACKWVDNSFQFGMNDLSELVYSDCDIYSGNPYTHQDFIKKKIHLLDAWSEQLGIDGYSETPIIDTARVSRDIKIKTDKIIEELGGKYIVIQLNGGQSPIAEGKGEYVEILKRNYPYAQELVDEIKKKYPEHTILNFSLPNEPILNGAIKLQAPYIFYFNILKDADKIICIDSALQHMAAAVEKKATVIWGETRAEHFGWDIHNNIVKDKQKGAPYFVALGPSPTNIEFNKPREIMGQLQIG